MHGWRESTEFANLRGPIGELADFTALVNIAEAAHVNSAFRAKFFAYIDMNEAQFAGAMRVSLQAEALLTWELMLGRRCADRQAWHGLAGELKAMYGHAVRLIGRGRGLDASAQHSLCTGMHRLINWDRYARQMQVFMTPEHAGYVSKGAFPSTLFDLAPTLGRCRKDSFSPELGYVAADGRSPSLGPVNGPYPIKEGELARSLLAIYDQLLDATHAVRAADVAGTQAWLANSGTRAGSACLAAAAAGCGAPCQGDDADGQGPAA